MGMAMIGGYYVIAVERSTVVKPREYVALVAGPFATWAEADKAGPGAITFAKANPSQTGNYDPDLLDWGIAEFWFHRQIDGCRNKELWIKPTPVTR
jgi:hypothetical protein